MRRNQIIIATGIGTFAALAVALPLGIAIGYFGVQILGRNTMYGVSAGVFGLGAGAGVGQVVVNRRRRPVVKQMNE